MDIIPRLRKERSQVESKLYRSDDIAEEERVGVALQVGAPELLLATIGRVLGDVGTSTDITITLR